MLFHFNILIIQKTQVATVVSYYNNWMSKWPTVFDLAKADIEVFL